ncbi:hypothetical protein GN316_14525 [Xylophilus sp. Kf1]|nr:hypothetical protein [Xylophilus sp. Kf1]
MSYELLEKLCVVPLPYVTSGGDVDLLKAYAAAGLIDAEFSATSPARDAVQIARISKVTPVGRKALLKSKGHR